VTDLAIGLSLPSLSFPMIDNEVCSCGVSRLEVEVEVEVRFTREVAAVSDDG
jgi:hypothetical protein